MCQYTLFDLGGVEIHSIECIEYCIKDQSMSKMSKIHYMEFNALSAMYVECVEDVNFYE